MTLGELRKITKNLPDDFEIEITGDFGNMNFIDIENISVDIGYSSKEVHFFGDAEQ